MEVIDQVRGLSPAFGRLQDVVVSADVRLAKPDPAIFRLTCERFGLQPQDILFVDDSAPNIATAQALGFDVHHFTDPAALQPALEARGFL
jgi:2-haloacid dehalogenase/putative hydrolase of the HAD superfamily